MFADATKIVFLWKLNNFYRQFYGKLSFLDDNVDAFAKIEERVTLLEIKFIIPLKTD